MRLPKPGEISQSSDTKELKGEGPSFQIIVGNHVVNFSSSVLKGGACHELGFIGCTPNPIAFPWDGFVSRSFTFSSFGSLIPFRPFSFHEKSFSRTDHRFCP